METIMHEEESSTDLPPPHIMTTDSMPGSSLSVSRVPTHSSSAPSLPMPSRAGDLLAIAQAPEPVHSLSTPQLPTFGTEDRSSGVGAEPAHIPVVLEPASAVSQDLMPPRESKLSSRATMPGRIQGSDQQLDVTSEAVSSISGWSDGSALVRGMKLLSGGTVEGKDASKQELKSRRKLQASLVDNAKVKFELLEKERLLKIAAQEIEELKRRLETESGRG